MGTSQHVAASYMINMIFIPVISLVCLYVWTLPVHDSFLAVFLYALAVYFIALIATGMVNWLCGLPAFKDKGKRKVLWVFIKAAAFASGVCMFFASMMTGGFVVIDEIGIHNLTWNFLIVYGLIWLVLAALPYVAIKK